MFVTRLHCDIIYLKVLSIHTLTRLANKSHRAKHIEQLSKASAGPKQYVVYEFLNYFTRLSSRVISEKYMNKKVPLAEEDRKVQTQTGIMF